MSTNIKVGLDSPGKVEQRVFWEKYLQGFEQFYTLSYHPVFDGCDGEGRSLRW